MNIDEFKETIGNISNKMTRVQHQVHQLTLHNTIENRLNKNTDVELLKAILEIAENGCFSSNKQFYLDKIIRTILGTDGYRDFIDYKEKTHDINCCANFKWDDGCLDT